MSDPSSSSSTTTSSDASEQTAASSSSSSSTTTSASAAEALQIAQEAEAARERQRKELIGVGGGRNQDGSIKMCENFGPPIVGSLREWRQANPYALAANLFGREDLTDADFVHLQGVHALYLRGLRSDITDKALEYIAGVKILNLQSTSKSHIKFTPDGFRHLQGCIEELDISSVDWITDDFFPYLTGLQRLSVFQVKTVTDAAFAHLGGGTLKKLIMWACSQPTLTDKAFTHLEGLEELDLEGLIQPTITDAALVPIAKGIRHLNISRMKQLTDTALKTIAEGGTIQTLIMHRLDQDEITEIGMSYLLDICNPPNGTLQELNIVSCNPYTISAYTREQFKQKLRKFAG